MRLHDISAAAAIRSMAEGSCTSEQLVAACLAQIDRHEKHIGAWACLDHRKSMAQARAADERRKNGDLAGRTLNGLPVGIKDIIDTDDMPTENGTVVHRNRRPGRDAAAVRLLREAGAVIVGKTVTAELAVYTPGKTRNPRDPARTPGGSSSGSAAAVAADMVPLALGTQTNGSVIRPASYCGVVGFKPTRFTIQRSGILRQSPSLDQVGVFSRSVDDALLIAAVLMNGRGSKKLEPFAAPRLAFVRTAAWPEASGLAKASFLDYVERLGHGIEEITLPERCSRAAACHRIIMQSEMAYHYRELHTKHRQQLSPMLVDMLDRGARVSLHEYLEAQDMAAEISALVEKALKDYDAVITPAAASEAPLGLASTGSPAFCTLWSLCGVPSVSLPVLTGANGMPLGLQLVSKSGNDLELLRVARYLEKNSV